MEKIKISVNESGLEGNNSIVRIDGVIDTLTATQLEDVLDRLIKRGRYGIILDLAGVEYISSAGWGIFISRIKEIRDNNGDIKLANMIPNVYEIYELLEFDNILSVYDSLDSARNSLNGTEPQSGPKKKAAVTATRTTVEELPFSADLPGRPVQLERTSVGSTSTIGLSPRDAILGAICEDPFYTISELKLILEESMLNSAPGWWEIFNILRKNRLLTRRSRFRYARQRRRRR
jgi:anti-sigma B factor antagonist